MIWMIIIIILTSSASLTLNIWSLKSPRSLNVDWDVMEKTNTKPWPFFMYKSLIAVNCSCNNIITILLLLHYVKHQLYIIIINPITICPYMELFHHNNDSNAITHSPCCVQYLQHALLTINFHLLSVRIFNGWIVFLYEYTLNKLDRLKEWHIHHHHNRIGRWNRLPKHFYPHPLIRALPAYIHAF
jgi:hypothetical protein